MLFDSLGYVHFRVIIIIIDIIKNSEHQEVVDSMKFLGYGHIKNSGHQEVVSSRKRVESGRPR